MNLGKGPCIDAASMVRPSGSESGALAVSRGDRDRGPFFPRVTRLNHRAESKDDLGPRVGPTT